MLFKVRPTIDRLAQDAYEAYAESTDNKNVRGEELPEWGDLTTPVQNAWKLAAEAVRHCVELNA
ncbi:hypothetical protein [Streptomyces similanensis]|uniref:Uncharacterized protein n=1 Tax=Streptomyces similanensis TaxID=1274988 RepID=A0ABP9KDD0_9ACTN